jgi:hypothetical protein
VTAGARVTNSSGEATLFARVEDHPRGADRQLNSTQQAAIDFRTPDVVHRQLRLTRERPSEDSVAKGDEPEVRRSTTRSRAGRGDGTQDRVPGQARQSGRLLPSLARKGFAIGLAALGKALCGLRAAFRSPQTGLA